MRKPTKNTFPQRRKCLKLSKRFITFANEHGPAQIPNNKIKSLQKARLPNKSLLQLKIKPKIPSIRILHHFSLRRRRRASS